MKLVKLVILTLPLVLTGCGKQTAEDAVAQKRYLTAEELNKATVLAKAYFNQSFPTKPGESEKGLFLECRPSDSNNNGLVTCSGKVPTAAGGYRDVTRYCGYLPQILGCSDKDE